MRNPNQSPNPVSPARLITLTMLALIFTLTPTRALTEPHTGSYAFDPSRSDHRAHAAAGTALTLVGAKLFSKLDHDGGPGLDAVMGALLAMIPLAAWEGLASTDYDNSDMTANLLGCTAGALLHFTIEF